MPREGEGGLCYSLHTHSPLVSRADLVPVFSFGENDIFRQLQFPEGSALRRLQFRFKQLAGFAPCLFVGRSLFFSRCWGLLPHPHPITVVGEPGSSPSWATGGQAALMGKGASLQLPFSLSFSPPPSPFLSQWGSQSACL